MLTLVTGTGRSGTTMFMRVLERAGVKLAPMTGYCEDLEAIRINGDIFRQRGLYTWKDTKRVEGIVGELIRKHPGPILKQTEIAHTLDVWAAARKDIQVIVCYRRLDHTRKSFRKLYANARGDLANSIVPEQAGPIGLDAWAPFTFGQLHDALLTCCIPYQYFRFPEDLQYPGVVYARLREMLQDFVSQQKFTQAMIDVADEAQVHFR